MEREREESRELCFTCNFRNSESVQHPRYHKNTKKNENSSAQPLAETAAQRGFIHPSIDLVPLHLVVYSLFSLSYSYHNIVVVPLIIRVKYDYCFAWFYGPSNSFLSSVEDIILKASLYFSVDTILSLPTQLVSPFLVPDRHFICEDVYCGFLVQMSHSLLLSSRG